MSQGELARRLGVTKQAVSQWVAGVKLPSGDRRRQLEDELGVDLRAWDYLPGGLP